MAPRADLQSLLIDLLGSDNVYFQPPPSVKMQYPCIVYNRTDLDILHADNGAYRNKKRYSVTIIDTNPDSDIPDKIAKLPLCSYDRFYAAEHLNHDVYTLFF